MSFISGDQIRADVVANENLSLYVWHQKDLDKLYAKQSVYTAYIYSLCGTDLAMKLRLMTDE